ncbi:hypothetical protein RB195_010362 [Necator americanus]|uniref:Phlebovirus glycoprotein G2 fusion domain-containing protein n=1 Tax=Necator americanus TaxID=51031 RepID=A0ABR1D0X3_NECAM
MAATLCNGQEETHVRWRSLMLSRTATHNSGVRAVCTPEKMHVVEEYSVIITLNYECAIFKDFEASTPTQHHAFPHHHSWTTKTITIVSVSECITCFRFSPYESASRITTETESGLIREEPATPLLVDLVPILLEPSQTVPPMYEYQRSTTFWSSFKETTYMDLSCHCGE